MLDFRIDTFLAVCETMNYTKAARALGITQPGVSQHIHYLEEYYGARLFAFEGRQMELTPAGRLLYKSAQTMRHDAQHLKELIDHDGGAVPIVFGASKTLGEYLLPAPLTDFARRFPDSDFRVQVGNTREILEWLEGGTVDFALVEGYFPREAYEARVFAREAFIPVCAAGHRFAGRLSCMADLLGECLILREEGSGTREIMENVLGVHNLSAGDFRRRIEIGSMDAIKAMVSEDLGITFLYEVAVRRELKEGVLTRIPLSGDPLYRDMHMIWPKGSAFDSYYDDIFRLLCGQ